MGLDTAVSSAPPKLQTDKSNEDGDEMKDDEYNEDMSPEEIAAAEAEKAEKLKQQQLLNNQDLQKDLRLKYFIMDMTEEDKDKMSCDEIFALYLRHVSKQVNESYYRTVLRFVLLYRECLNEYGWLKRRDHYHKAY